MSIVFLPLDIDMSSLNFKQDSNSKPAGAWMQYWDASFISEETKINTGLDQVLNQMPFTKITRLFYKMQSIEVPSHVDVHSNMTMEPGEFEHIKSVEPSGYRIVIKGQKDSLFVYNGKEWINALLPDVPCCYLLHATEGKHKVKMDFGREIIYVRGYLDPIEHKKLIERSLVKYKEYAIYDENL
jgi:hypothetical protein